MPTVTMRRTTKVFGFVTPAPNSGRVLRSGRRLLPETDKPKKKKVKEDDDVEATTKATVRRHTVEAASVGNKDDDVAITRERKKSISLVSREVNGGLVDRMFGIVYNRKRKRFGSESSELSRKKKKEKEGRNGSHIVLAVIVKPYSDLFSYLLFLVLRYIRRASVKLEELSAFFLSDPIFGVFASRGIHFLKGPPTANIGICQLFGITQFMPSFCVDFSAVPPYFKYLHYAMLLKSMYRSLFLVHNLISVHSDVEDVELEIDFHEFQNERQIICDALTGESSDSGTVTPDVIEMNDSSSLHSSINSSRLAGRNRQHKTRGIQRRRRSLRKKKAENPSLVGLCKSNRAVAYDLMACRNSNVSLSAVATAKKLRSLANSSVIVDSIEGLNSRLCSANILVTGPDKYYRVEGAIVTLEMSASREWLLFVKKDGLTRCTFKAEKVMRPYSANRLTHVILFSLDNGWVLEFANCQDWIVFKYLYKECSDRNIPASVTKFIPVPVVREVFGYADSNSFIYHRPDTYISANGDELSRAMTRKTANYDMDSADEEWLSKFNNEFNEHVSEDNFELVIDALEKVYYYDPAYSFEEKSVPCGCQDLGSKEVLEAVYSYWMRKRKRSFLIRVFQIGCVNGDTCGHIVYLDHTYKAHTPDMKQTLRH
ncbi:putative enhancer of polycomb protein [Lupinus albus]|uniref:Enhancer of polycomb-like protein n=1 Tax=Lupinus albus TaxID=3870 RepID=A0A6A4NTR3_LUPAL|nr:putative enhancer of polycomb protein [Lupinus albus]